MRIPPAPEESFATERPFDPIALQRWLRAAAPELPEGIEAIVVPCPGGEIARTFEIRIGSRILILRRAASDDPDAVRRLRREFTLLRKLAPHFPCPRPLWSCEDASVIGASFFVMEKIDGLALHRDLPSSPPFAPDAARRIGFTLIDTLAALHVLEPRSLDLDHTGLPASDVRQSFETWRQCYEATRDDAADGDAVVTWLDRNLPQTAARHALLHNDYRFEHLVVDPADPTRVRGVIDWEYAAVGDARLDLGQILALWVQADDPPLLQALRTQPSEHPGMPTRRELLARYETRRAEAIAAPLWFYVFGLFRLGVLAQRGFRRHRREPAANPRLEDFGWLARGYLCAARRALERDTL